MDNPCLNCGACCAFFRVSFYWTEADASCGGRVPEDLTERIHPFFLAMRGTLYTPVRCAALRGDVGGAVHCAIYPNRPSPCRELVAWDEHHRPTEKCTSARAAFGLAPLHAKVQFDSTPHPTDPDPISNI